MDLYQSASDGTLSKEDKPPEPNDFSTANPVIGRTGVAIGTRFGWWSIPIAIVLLSTLLGIAHMQAGPGKRAPIFGVELYTKGANSEIPEILEELVRSFSATLIRRTRYLVAQISIR